MRVIWENPTHRIVELPDDDSDLDILYGDMLNPECYPDIPLVQLEHERREFERKVMVHGVFGYELESKCSCCESWLYVDSCYGFVGAYDENSAEFNHYIVDEMKGQVKNDRK